MRRPTREMVRCYARYAQSLIVTSRKAMLVWWDVDCGDFLVLPAKSRAARVLTDRLDDDHLCCYVGVFDPSATRGELVDALESHAAGKMRGAE